MITRKIEYDKYARIINSMQDICLPGDEPRQYKNNDFWFIVFSGDTPAAFSVVSEVSENLWYLSRAGVMPEYRGYGLQLRMIKARVKAVLKAYPDAAIVTDTVTENWPSSNNLIKAGFKTFWPQEPWGLPHSIYWQYKP